MNVILSIEPKYARKIISGEKKVEFRKSIFKKSVDKVYIYSSSPDKKIIGFFTISNIIKDEPENLWSSYGENGIISKNDFKKYFKNKKFGYAICIEKVTKFSNEINPQINIKNFVAPQSFMYIESDIKNMKHDIVNLADDYCKICYNYNELIYKFYNIFYK